MRGKAASNGQAAICFFEDPLAWLYPLQTSRNSNLDVVRVVDRLGFTSGCAYDPMERKTGVTNALGYVTH